MKGNRMRRKSLPGGDGSQTTGEAMDTRTKSVRGSPTSEQDRGLGKSLLAKFDVQQLNKGITSLSLRNNPRMFGRVDLSVRGSPTSEQDRGLGKSLLAKFDVQQLNKGITSLPRIASFNCLVFDLVIGPLKKRNWSLSLCWSDWDEDGRTTLGLRSGQSASGLGFPSPSSSPSSPSSLSPSSPSSLFSSSSRSARPASLQCHSLLAGSAPHAEDTDSAMVTSLCPFCC
ncbi:hypothetical protein DY000_02022584 [Brassica cretica]|uniref:Uncharacterized protein n=1 Tax=Brassica cretica TaxID=69181 RepID=A0ABQ7EC01_BRACR|nr:hypothetical protein DY000_02022584 [Brassica cretica]